jgi:cytochrome c oxidase subunit 3
MIKPWQTLLAKPWLPLADGNTLPPNDLSDTLARQAAGATALHFFIAVVSVLFFLLCITFLSRSQYPDFNALAGQPWQPFFDPSRLWFNTALLALGSVAMQCGLYCSDQQRLNATIIAAGIGALFAGLFLLAQFSLWLRLWAMGFYLASNPANSYFYLLTAIHGLHLSGGLVALIAVGSRAWRGAPVADLDRQLRLCTAYWHFLLVIWLLLFALLTSQPNTLNALAALCGF